MKTLFIGQNSIHLTSVDSTNSYASELLRKTKPAEGTLIYTFEQRNGRGQRGNYWECEPNKNATFSLILYPGFLPAQKQFLLAKIASLAVADLMAEMLEAHDKTGGITIKWPNDIYIGNKKIAGILIETSLRENAVQNAIIGIGVNINQRSFNATNAISLAMITKKEYNPEQCIERLCEFIEARYLQLKANKIENIDSEYKQELYQFNEWKNYTSDQQIFRGKIIGISVLGKLQVELESAKIKEFDLKEITFASSS
ncbi:MAG: biotin--[acetyl-CoA-carboxylase] ligase [Bacteroidota bacterium]